MATKYQYMSALSLHTSQEITSTPFRWLSFLNTASYIYKYPFNDQMMIYAQRPDTQACATLDIWNKKMNRWVNRGAKGIALIDDSGPRTTLKYVFDMRDTHLGRDGRTPFLWKMEDRHKENIRTHLTDIYALEDDTRPLPEILLEVAKNSVMENLDIYLSDFHNSVDYSSLEELDDLNREIRFRDTLVHSVQYMLLFRCGYDVDVYLEPDDFSYITDFNSLATVSQLGFAVNEISKPILMDIGREIRSMEQQNYLSQNNLVSHSVTSSEISNTSKQEIIEGGTHLETDIHESRGLSDSESNFGQSDTGNTREIRDAEEDVPEEPSGRDISVSSPFGQTESASSGNRTDSKTADRADSDTISSDESGSEQSGRSDGMDNTHELTDADSGGTGVERIDLQVAPTDDTENTDAENPPVSFFLPEFPTQEQQITELGTYTPPSMLNMFVPGEVLDEFLRSGSNRSQGILRIAALYMTPLDVTERAQLLAQEYHSGDIGIRLNGRDFAIHYDDNGILIAPGKSVKDAPIDNRAIITWTEADERIQDLLHSGHYLPQVFLDNALSNERTEIATSLLYMYHDYNHEDHEYPYPNKDALTDSYPKATARLAEQLSNPDELKEQQELLHSFSEDYKKDRTILRFHYHNIPAMQERLNRLSHASNVYRTADDFSWDIASHFINPDAIQSYLCKRSLDSRLDTYSFYLQHSDTKERAEFLKQLYGTGGQYPALSYADDLDVNYDAKGLKFSLRSQDGPVDTALLKWTQVASRIDHLLQEHSFLSEEDLQQIPEYEKKHLAWAVVSFASALPFETKDKRDTLLQASFDYNSSTKAIYPLLDDTGKLTELVSKMEKEFDALSPDYRNYDLCEKKLQELQAYRDGSFTLFPKPLQSEHASPQKDITPKVHNSIDSTDESQMQLTDFMDFSEGSDEQTDPTVSDPIEKNTAPDKYTTSEVKEEPSDTLSVGMKLNIEDREYQIDSINEQSGKISLIDLTFQKSMGFPISRVEDIEYIRSILEPPSPKITEPVQESDIESSTSQPIVTEKETAASTQEPVNFHITDDDLGTGGSKAKFRANIEAIHLLQDLEYDERLATPEEQEILSRYVGWGGLPMAFDSHKPEWEQEYQELKSLLSPAEYEAARASTLNAHYTQPVIIRSIYETLSNMGFTKGNILEPACGTGNFFGCLPETMSDSKLYGVELDSITGRIAKQLYQKAAITIDGFEKTNFPDDFFDVVIGNVPFGDYQIPDRRYDNQHFQIHDYFIAKSLDQVRPGGVVAVLTSSGTMDKQNTSTREYLAKRADLLGAIRLPNNAFRKNAGTDVVADILFFQKRDRAPIELPEWVNLGVTEDGYSLNQYFISHPDMVLGELKTESTQYRHDKVTVHAKSDVSLETQLHDAIQNIHGTISENELSDSDLEEEAVSILADPSVPNFSYTLVDGKIYYRENSKMNRMDLPLATSERIKGMIGLRETTRKLLNMQLEDASDEEIHSQMALLNEQYDTFTAKFGLINSSGNRRAFNQDSAYCLLASLEILDNEGKLKSKADIFSKRTIKKSVPVTSVDTAVEALSVSMGEKARVDLSYMSQLYGKEPDEICEELRGLIFQDPISESWQTADEYLSGNVREKLRTAETFAQNNPSFAVNVEYLKHVQPEELSATDIDVRLGVNWIDADIITQFMVETFHTPRIYRSRLQVQYAEVSGEWSIRNKFLDSANPIACVTYGSERATAYRLLEDALNQRSTKIYDIKTDPDGTEHRVVNKGQTILAQQKQDTIKEAFKNWIFRDPARREMLVTRYNERFNSIRPREYDGSHLNFPGMNPQITLRPHQKNVIAHILYGNNCLAAHCVGSGKTYSCIAAAMESKRLGLCQKALFVVPNHLTDQWGSEILNLYPNAKVLVSTQKDFEPANRKKFCSRIATGDYDCVVIGHTQFEKIPLSPERRKAIIQNQIDDLTTSIEMAKYENGESFTIKQMESMKKKLAARLAKLNDDKAKDRVVTFEQLGVDRLFIDESQEFKNLYCFTKMSNVAGISTTDAQKSSDMYAKCQYMDELTGERGVTFATGTPISNSMTELYTLMRYLQSNMLRSMGLQHFDSWAAQFGETITSVELAPEGTGYRAKTRFAKFFNLPELMAAWKECADIQTSDMLNLPTPKVEYENVLLKPSDTQKEIVASLGERAELIHKGGVDSSIDNMLKVTNDGRKLALDQRLINPLLPENPQSKSTACAEKAFKIWEETAEKKLTQVIFCDLSTPKGDGTFNVYDDIKNKLISKGIPEEEIAFIHDAHTDAQKANLFAKVRSGEIRIILGSTSKMGAGTNIQDKLVALHHLDVPWRPSDVEQQEGRILRQGNENELVHIYRYLTEETFDAYMWQILENKQRFIGQVMTGKSPARSCEDTDETSLKFAEVKALASGNPLIMEKTELDTAVAKLKLMKASHTSQHYMLEDALLKTYPKQEAEYKSLIEGLKEDISTVKNHLPQDAEHFHMEVNGKTYTDRKEAGTALLSAASLYKKLNVEGTIGTYAGFSLQSYYESLSNLFYLKIKGKTTHHLALGSDPSGNITRINNMLKEFENTLPKIEEQLTELYTKIASAKEELTHSFSHEEELSQKLERPNEVNALLNMDDKSTTSDIHSAQAVESSEKEPVSYAAYTSSSIPKQAYADKPKRSSILDKLHTKQKELARHAHERTENITSNKKEKAL